MNLETAAAAIAKFAPVKPLIPIYSNVLIQGEQLIGFDGTSQLELTLDEPVLADERSALVCAAVFAHAIEAAGEPKFSLGEKYLSVTGPGAFLARLPLNPIDAYPKQDWGEFDYAAPRGLSPENGKLLAAALELIPKFASPDSVRWNSGVCFEGDRVRASNGSTLIIDAPSGLMLAAQLNVPAAPLSTLKVFEGHLPTTFIAADRFVRIEYGDVGAFQTVLVASKWPDVSKLLDGADDVPEVEGFFEAVRRLAPLAGDAAREVRIADGKIYVSDAEAAATGLPDGVYGIKELLDIAELAPEIDLGAYPEPVRFHEPLSGIVGVLSGRKD